MTVLTLADAKIHLNIAANVSTYDAELQGFIDATVPQIERYLGGPAEVRAVTETVERTDCGRAIPLTFRPFVSLTSITIGGVETDISTVYPTPGRVLRKQFGFPFWPTWIEPCVVTYQAGQGSDALPAISLAAKIIVAHLWSTQRGNAGGRGPSANNEYGSTSAGTVAPGFGFAIPNRALELLNPFAPETGLA